MVIDVMALMHGLLVFGLKCLVLMRIGDGSMCGDVVGVVGELLSDACLRQKPVSSDAIQDIVDLAVDGKTGESMVEKWRF
jgi:hypothetical protein